MSFERFLVLAAAVRLPVGCSALDGSPYDRTVFARSYKSATRELEERAATDDAAAQCRLGFVNAYGEGVPVNAQAALKWLNLAAEQGHLQAQAQLALLYRDSRSGVLQDLAKAARWFRQAAIRGHVRSQYVLGRMYQGGLGAPQNDAPAVQWLQAAAYENHPRAQHLLAHAYIDATGVQLDPVLAYVWARVSLTKGAAQPRLLLGVYGNPGRFGQLAYGAKQRSVTKFSSQFIWYA